MDLVIITSRVPYPLEKGDKLRVFHQIRYLSQKHNIYLLSLCANESEIQEGKAEMEKYCKEIHFFKIPLWKRYLQLPMALFYGMPFTVKYFFNGSIRNKIQRLILKINPDHIYCQLIRTASYVRKMPYTKTIDYMDSFSLGFKRRASRSSLFLKPAFYLESKMLATYESSVYKDFNRHTIISKQDRESLDILSRENVQIIPNGVDQDFFYPRPASEPEYHLLFCGNMGYAPNVKAAQYIYELAPVLKNRIPNLKILIAGARPHPMVKKMHGKHGIVISGWMDDIREAYWNSMINIAPIFTGSGLQNKMLEAMACGIPCITTEIVGRSVGGQAEKDYLIAADKEEFSEKISALVNDSKKRNILAENGLKLIRKKFNWDHYSELLNDSIVKASEENIFN